MSEINDAQTGLKDLYDVFRGIQSNTASSLTEAIKETQINSSVYIQNKIASDEIAPPLMNMLNQIYCSFIITAIGLNQYVSDNRTVRDAVRSVSTESYNDALELVTNEFGNKGQQVSLEKAGVVKLQDKEKRLMASKVIELELDLKTKKQSIGEKHGGDSVKASIYLTCTLIPRFMPSDVIKSLVTLKYRPKIGDRWAQFTSGEISFWKDFVLCGDLLNAERKGFKKDTTGILYEIASNQNNKLSKQLFETILLGVPRNNMASTIMIVDKNTMDNISTKTHFSWDNYRDRQKFFFETSTMMMVMVDPMYNLVDVYFNGLKNKANYTFDMINSFEGSKGKDIDMTKVMSQLAQGNAPQRF